MFMRPFDRYTLVAAPRSTPEILAKSGSPSVQRTCEFCTNSLDYHSDTELEVHKQREHRKEIVTLFEKNKNVCRMCLKKTSNKAGLLKHFKTSHLFCDSKETRIHRDVYICDQCDRLFFSKLMLAYHLSQTHRFKTPGIECPKCEKYILYGSTYSHFEGHMMGSIFTCPICFLKFHSRNMLQEHVRSYHSCGSYRCTMCNYESKKHSNLVFHTEKIHKRKSSEDLNLSVVKKCFIEAGNEEFGNYVPPVATKGVSVKGVANLCILCREICADEEEMLDHYTTVHVTANHSDTKKKYLCNCGEVFFNNVLLKHHIFKLKNPHRMIREEDLPKGGHESPEEVVPVEWLSVTDEETIVDSVTGDDDTACHAEDTIGDKTDCGDEVERGGDNDHVTEDCELTLRCGNSGDDKTANGGDGATVGDEQTLQTSENYEQDVGDGEEIEHGIVYTVIEMK